MNKIITPIAAILLTLSVDQVSSQNISVNTTGAANSTSSMFEVLQPSTTNNTIGLFSRHSGAATNAYAIWAEATAGTNKYALVVPSGGGKVGIGTTTPTSSFHVADPTGNDAGPWVTLEGGANVYSNTGLRFWDKGTDLNNENVIEFGHNSTFVSAARIKSLNPAINATTGGRLYLETASNNTGTYNTNQLVLNNNGNVGIGTNAAQQKLDVRGVAAINGGTLYASANNHLTTGALNIGDYGRNYGGGSGWGANTAGILLECLDNTEVAVHDFGSRISSMLYFEGAGTNRLQIGRDMGWGSPSTVSLWGVVGVGTLSPSSGFGQKLEVYSGNLHVKNGATNLYTGLIGTGTTTTGLVFRKDGTRHAGIRWDGRYLILNDASSDCCVSDNWTNAAQTTWDVATGYMGIGTSTPGYKLTVTGGGIGGTYGLTPNYASWGAYGAGDGGAAIYNDNAGYQKLMIVGNTSGGGGIRRIGMWDYLTLNGSGDITGTLAVGRTTLNPGAQVHINSNLVVGDLGAGSNQTLEVVPAGGDVYVGSATQEGDLFVRNTAGTGNVHFSGGAFSSHYILNGYFGIGTSTPGNQLTVTGSAVFGGTAGTSAEPIEVRGAFSGVAHKDRDGTSTRWVQYASGGTMRLWNDANGDRMAVTTAGNVGIGTSTPSTTLQLNSTGNTELSTVVGKDLYINSQPGVHSSIIMMDNPVPLASGTHDLGSAALCWRTLYYTGLSACSDVRYKKEIETLGNSLENISKLRGVSYFWKTDEFPNRNFGKEKQIGFIAQELEQVYPEFVQTDEKGFKTVDYSRLAPVLVEAIKEQQAIVKKLESEVVGLKAENHDLKMDFDKRLKMIEQQLGVKAEK